MATIDASIAALKDVSVIVNEVRETAVAIGSNLDAVEDIIVALHEALTNSFIHGYQRQPGQVTIEVKQHNNDLWLCLRDKAPLFNPLTVPTPDTALPLEERGKGGMGIHMMRNFTDDFHYHITDTQQNEVILIKKDAFSEKA